MEVDSRGKSYAILDRRRDGSLFAQRCETESLPHRQEERRGRALEERRGGRS